MMPVEAMDSQEWNNWITEQGSKAGFGQTTTWAAVNADAIGADSIVVSIERTEHRRIGALFDVRQYGDPGGGPYQWLKRLLGGRGRLLECIDGPVIREDATSRDFSCFLKCIDEQVRRSGAYVVNFHMPTTAISSTSATNLDIRHIFAANGYTIMPWLTALVDLSVDEDEIFARFNRSARKGIRRCEKEGIWVEKCDCEAMFLEDFCSTYYGVSGKGTAFDLANKRRALATWRIGDDAYRFFVARDMECQVLGTLGSYRFNGIATEIMSSRTAEADARHLPVQDLLHWELFRAHKALGDHTFNLAGFNPDPKTPKEIGIRRFKEKWGGSVVEVPYFTKHFETIPLKYLRKLLRWLPRHI